MEQILPENFQPIFAKLSARTSKSLAGYLERILPSISDDWWNKAVMNKLSFHQRRRAEQRGIDSLHSFDIAALLRLLDQNWYPISIKMNLSSESRHFVKEMQTVRNRWSHAGTDSFSGEDIYRDLDTLQRFAVVIEADDALIQEIRDAKQSLLAERAVSDPNTRANEGTLGEDGRTIAIEFELGQIVFLKSNPEVHGAVISIVPGKLENRYKVFANGESQTFYASQIQAEETKDKDFSLLPCQQFHPSSTVVAGVIS
jgi:hypothetical protein